MTPVDRFDRLWSGDGAWDELDRHKIPLVCRTVERLGATVRNLLDVGCGDGRLLRALPDPIRKVGIDRSRAGLERAGAAAVLGSSRGMPFPSGSFDLVLCCDLLEHLADPDHDLTIAELRRVARHYVLLTIPFREDLAAANARCPACGLIYNVDTHIRRYGPRAYKNLKRGFAGWVLEQEVPHGPVHRHYWSAVTRGHQWLFGRHLHSERAVCPRCGEGTGPGPGRSRNPLYRAYCRATNEIGKIWPFTHRHERMLLFRRVP